MPVVVVTAPQLHPEDQARAARTLATDIASSLHLQPRDVHVSLVASAIAATGDHDVAAWPVVVLHGSRRAPSLMQAAADAARVSVAVSWRRPTSEIWVQWLVSEGVS